MEREREEIKKEIKDKGEGERGEHYKERQSVSPLNPIILSVNPSGKTQQTHIYMHTG